MFQVFVILCSSVLLLSSARNKFTSAGFVLHLNSQVIFRLISVWTPLITGGISCNLLVAAWVVFEKILTPTGSSALTH